MSKVTETSLIIKKETKFDKIRKTLFMMFFRINDVTLESNQTGTTMNIKATNRIKVVLV